MQIKEITSYLESLAPLATQESYDNSGFICGDKNIEVTNALISLDCTEDIIQEAIDRGCNLVISHHPIVFVGLKSFTGKNYVERTVIKAIKNDIAIYAIHTNLDNYEFGVNKKIGNFLNIKSPRILSPNSASISKLITLVPTSHKDQILEALFNAGAGQIGNYSECSFSSEGQGSFKANKKANQFIGETNTRHLESEAKVEVIIPNHKVSQVLNELIKNHPYEEVAYDIIQLQNKNKNQGSGMIGELENEMDTVEFLQFLKDTFKCGIIKHTELVNSKVKKIAWCGGSGSFLLHKAKQQQADIFITGDFKYHEFFDAENQIIIADIGHFESEQFTIELISELLSKKFIKFAPCLTEINTNPVKYY